MSRGSDLYNYGEKKLSSYGNVINNYTKFRGDDPESYGRQYAIKPAKAGSAYKYECHNGVRHFPTPQPGCRHWAM